MCATVCFFFSSVLPEMELRMMVALLEMELRMIVAEVEFRSSWWAQLKMVSILRFVVDFIFIS